MEVRRNKSGSYKLRLPIIRNANETQQTIEVGLATNDRVQAFRTAYSIIRVLAMLGNTYDMKWHVAADTPLTVQEIAERFMDTHVIYEDDIPPIMQHVN